MRGQPYRRSRDVCARRTFFITGVFSILLVIYYGISHEWQYSAPNPSIENETLMNGRKGRDDKAETTGQVPVQATQKTHWKKPMSMEVALIVKTGMAVPPERLVAQLDTFASSTYGRSPANTIILSDGNASIKTSPGSRAWETVDVVGPLGRNPVIVNSEKFQLYEKQKQNIAAGQDVKTTDSAGTNNDGWTIDAFKFIPGYDLALKSFPEAKWFIGIDDDTYVLWDSLLAFLGTLNHKREWFIGTAAVMLANNALFLHGGSIIVVSRAAMEARFIRDAEGVMRFNEAAVEYCCGDGVLGMAMQNSSVGVNGRFGSYFNGNPPEITRLSAADICQPIFGMHHLDAPALRLVHERMSSGQDKDAWHPDSFTSRGSLLQHYSSDSKWTNAADLRSTRDWDYVMSEDPKETHHVSLKENEATLTTCQTSCEAQSLGSCLAWTFDAETKACRLSSSVVPGRGHVGRTSGMNIRHLQNLMQQCRQLEDWRLGIHDDDDKIS